LLEVLHFIKDKFLDLIIVVHALTDILVGILELAVAELAKATAALAGKLVLVVMV
jgi:hypothetical protein